MNLPPDMWYSPFSGALLEVAYKYPGKWRRSPDDIWRFNPWTGTKRSVEDIVGDPHGQLIAAPATPLYAAVTPVLSGNSISTTLAERGARYGDFTDHAKIAQALQNEMRRPPNWNALSAVQRQALTVIADKIARILSGDPNYADNWHDIQGYAKLAEDRLPKTPGE